MAWVKLINTETRQTSRDELHCNEPPETLEAAERHCWNIHRNKSVINFFFSFSLSSPTSGVWIRTLCSRWLCRVSPELRVTAAKAQPQSHCALGDFILPSLQSEANSYEVDGGAWRDEVSSVCLWHSSVFLMVFVAPAVSVEDPVPFWVTSHHWIPTVISGLLPLKQVLLSHHLLPSAELTYVLSLLWPQGIYPFPWTHLTKRKGTMNSFSEVLMTDSEPDHHKINAGKNGKSRSNPSSWEGRKHFYPHFALWSLFYLLEH